MFGPRWKDNTENKRITFWDLNKVLIYFLLLFTLEAVMQSSSNVYDYYLYT